jgi:hypothetical protein
MNGKEEIRKLYFWIMLPGILAGVAAVITSIAVLVLVLHPVGTVQSEQQDIQNQEKDLLHKEINFRLEEIRSLLDREPLLAWQLRSATSRLTAHGVGISEAYVDTELRTLLFELEQISPDDEKVIIEKIRKLFNEFSSSSYEIPASDGALIDPQTAQLARDKFEEIENEWQTLLRKQK